ncbi:unnamed protein product [marine sediment metagenome]|uniref:Uncharacterized protein n=1 Tax=marine sediment metagenome TaxID=412755 RepID=X1L3Q5_9ZZZZ
MQQTLLGFRIRKTIVDPEELAKIFDIVARDNYRLGAKMGYRKGREDERAGEPFDLEIGRLP